MLRDIQYFFEDQWIGIAVGAGLGALVLFLALLFTDSGFNEADCAEEVVEAEAALVGEIVQSIGPQLVEMQIQIQLLQAELGSNGSSGDSGIRMNEELGAYSDAAGEFYCFPTEGAGFPSSG